MRYDTPGLRDLRVTGTDSCGDSDEAVGRFEVLPAIPTGPPHVTIIEPALGSAVWRDGSINLVGKAKDPEGLSPIQFEWLIESPFVIGGSEIVIHTDSGLDDQALAPFSWSPAPRRLPPLRRLEHPAQAARHRRRR